MLLMAFMAPWGAKGQTRGVNTLLSENFESLTSIPTSYSATDLYAYNAGSGNNWTYDASSGVSSSKCAKYKYNSSYAANCYLVSTPFNVSSTTTQLNVSLYQKVASSTYAETFEVFFVKASDITDGASITTATHYEAIASASYTNTSYAERTGSATNSDFQGESVRLVVHCTSKKDYHTLYIDNITVTEPKTDPDITLDPTEATILTGNTQTLTAILENVTGTPTITYTSDDESVATVSGSGTSATVTAVGEGTATITATMTYNETDYTATCDITVADACQPTWSGSDNYYISKFVANSFENSSTGTARTTTNYYNTESIISAEPGDVISCTITMSTSGTYGFALWVDFDQDGLDADDRMFYSNGYKDSPYTNTFTIPANTPAGVYRLRILGDFNTSTVSNPCGTYQNGEAEDYKLVVTIPNCAKPSGLTKDETTAHTATLHWTNGEEGQEAWQIAYSTDYSFAPSDDFNPNGTTEWLANVTTNPATIEGLAQNTTYYAYVRANCGGTDGMSGWCTTKATFSTIAGNKVPTDLAISGISTNTATASWNGVATNTLHQSYELYVTTEASIPDPLDPEDTHHIKGITSPTHPLTELEAGTTYNVWVRDYCGADGYSAWSAKKSFDTDCLPFEIEYTGWTEDFESYTATSNSTAGTMPDCWSSIYKGTSSGYNVKVCNTTSYAPTSSGKYIFMVASSNTYYGSPNYAIMPQIENSYNNLIVEFDYKMGNSYGTLDFGYMTDKSDESTFNAIGDAVAHSTTKAHCTKDLRGLNIPENAYLAFRFSETTTYSPYLGIDNLFIKDVTTFINPPTNIEVSGTTAHSATINWDANGETAWKVQYSSDNQTTWSTAVNVNTNSCALTLEPNKTYYARVCAVRGENTSSWCVSDSFLTDCGAISVATEAYSYDFETTQPWNCWEVLSGTTSIQNVTSTSASDISKYHSATHYLRFSGTTRNILALPEFVEETNTLQIKFWTRPESYTNSSCGTFDVGYITNLSDTSTFVKIERYKYNDWTSDTHVQKTVYLDNVPADARIAFRQSNCASNWYWFVDDVEVSVAPLCRPVKNLAYSNVTNHSATITWTKGTEDQDTWQLKYNKEDDFDPDTEGTLVDNLDATTYTFNKTLDAASVYYIYVRANCGGEPSAWSNTVCTFTTGAAWPAPTTFTASNVTKNSVDLVWNSNGGDFLSGWDLYYVKSETAPEAPTAETSATETTVTLPTNEAPYQVTGLDPESRYYFWVRANHEGTTHSTWEALSGSYITTLIACHVPTGLAVSEIQPTSAKVTWNGDASGYNLRYRTPTTATVILTAGDVWGDGSGYQMLLDADADQYGVAYNGGWTITDYSDFEYLIPTNADFDDNSTNVVFENSVAIQIPAGTYDWYITNPSPGVMVYIAGSNGNVPGSYDNYEFEAGKTYEFVPSIYGSYDGVDVTITGGAKSGEPKEAAWIVVEDVTSPYTLPGLTEETNYEVQVQAVCGGEDGESAWSSSYNFATPSACDKPINLAVSALHESASLSWTGYQTNYNVQYRTAEIPEHLETFFFEDFEDGIPNTWTILTEGTAPNANGWVTATDGGSTVAVSYSYAGGTNYNADNWLITPQINLQGSLKFKVRDNDDSTWNDEFEVLLSTTGTAKADFTTTLRAMQSPSKTLTEIDPIDLSSYAGQQGYIAIHHLSSGQYQIIVDDFGIYGAEIPTVPAGEWISRNNVTSPCEITGLTADTDYEWHVQGICKGATTTEWSEGAFTTIDNNTKIFKTAGNWDVASNWDGGIPTIANNAIIRANATVPADCVATANNITSEGATMPTLTIKDGGQLHTKAEVTATFVKVINAATVGLDENWYLISSPIGTVNTSAVTNLLGSGEHKYNLYNFNETTSEWNGNGYGSGFITLTQGIGYLYRNNDGADLTYTGTTKTGDVSGISLTQNGTGSLSGFNLIGNPYPHNITSKYLTFNNDATFTGCYTLKTDGAWVSGLTTEIKPGEGFFVQVNKATTATFHETDQTVTKNNQDYIQFMVSNSEYEDVTFALFDKGNGLNKINHRNSLVPMLFIPQDGENYAIANMSDDTEAFNLNFKAATTGKYTLKYNAKGEFSYLHVIDRLTGADTDMLLEGEYSFIASNNDNDAHFLVKLSYKPNYNIEGSNIFAYQNGSDIVVMGEGDLQIFDVMGRMVSTQRISGIETINVSANGVYIFRLVGETVKTQKIIVK